MDKVVNKTVAALTRFGERIERHMLTEEDGAAHVEQSGSGSMFPSVASAFHRPLNKKDNKDNIDSSKQRGLVYGERKRYSSDNLAASPAYSSFNNYRQNPLANSFTNGANSAPYGTGIGRPLNQYNNAPQNSYSNNAYSSYNGAYGNQSFGGVQGNVGYAPEYYIAERRQVELVPAPQPRIIQQQVPVPYAVDRPVPQPYPVEVFRPYPVDRPVPYPVPQPVIVNRPVAVPSQPVCVPVPVPCYVPVGIPVPSPPPSPVMFEQTFTQTQRWVTGSPAMMNQRNYLAGSPAMGMNPYMAYGNAPFIH